MPILDNLLKNILCLIWLYVVINLKQYLNYLLSIWYYHERLHDIWLFKYFSGKYFQMLFSRAIIQNDWYLKLNSHNIQSKLQTRTHAFHISVSVCAQTWINRTQKLYYKQVSDSQDKLMLRMEAYTSSITLSFYSKYVILYLNQCISSITSFINRFRKFFFVECDFLCLKNHLMFLLFC